ncbi:zinc finger protein-domain-containing protein [Podospora didyma]|uniref:Zinc finger protein-domain-containing protein n=1 Tax=Podospora didyma TaxID=330526 RepID=A0AAE0NQ65_9PEZI|nr:zinc finger protein-domain-containing protein [Podospora didyma]
MSSSANDGSETRRLSEVLDHARNEEFKASRIMPDGISPSSDTLRHLLSLNPEPARQAGSAASIVQARITEALGLENIGFRKIGFGQCGLIFERPGFIHVVKVARPGFADALRTDFVVHNKVFSAFHQDNHDNAQCRIPNVYYFIERNDKSWWDAHGHLFSASNTASTASFPLPAFAVLSERILPLPKMVRQCLINTFCPPHLRESVSANPINRDCVARVYLGRSRKPTAPMANFPLRNFNLHLDQMLQLGLPVEDYAAAMGEALALIHWSANVDGYDIEFVLGSEAEQSPKVPSTTLRQIRMWVLDFNLCTSWEENLAINNPDAVIQQLVLAFFENDPYYPLPLMESDIEETLWSKFAGEYARKAELLLRGKDETLAKLPSAFLDACIQREKRKLQTGRGHGHRDYKG